LRVYAQLFGFASAFLIYFAPGSNKSGWEIFRYDPRHYLIFTVDLPVTFQVEEASKEKPYFGFRLGLDPALVASVVMESDIQIMKGDAITKAMNVSSIDADLFVKLQMRVNGLPRLGLRSFHR
jgi:hypothetical protein